MEYASFIYALLKQKRGDSFAKSTHLTLGEIIKEIENCSLKNNKGEAKSISFDFFSAIPTRLYSWHGLYDELALGYELKGGDGEGKFSDMTGERLLMELKLAIGKTYTGWKDGDFCMGEDTPVCIANMGNDYSAGILGVQDAGRKLVIRTTYCEYELSRR